MFNICQNPFSFVDQVPFLDEMEFAKDPDCKFLDGSLVFAIKMDYSLDPVVQKKFPRCISLTNKTMEAPVVETVN